MKRRSNCFFFAWWMFAHRGGYCTLRRCQTFPGFHWLWIPPDRNPRRWLSYAPFMHKDSVRATAHKLWYSGRIYRGDTWAERCNPHPIRDAITTLLFFIVGWGAMHAAGYCAAMALRIWEKLHA